MKGKRITVIAKMKAKRGMEDKLKSELLNLVVPSRLDDGCINYDLYQATDDKSVFIFHENWNSKENLDKHLKTSHLQSLFAKLDTMLIEPPEVTLYEMISQRIKYECPDCRGIKDNPEHYNGDAITPERKAKCVLYEAFTLALAIQALRDQKWREEMTYDIDVKTFTPSEALKTAALVKIRILYDFLYNSKSEDGFKITDTDFGFKEPYTPPFLQSLQSNGELFTKKSINKFLVHLAKQSITKPKCIPQPKFEYAEKATINDAIMIIEDVFKFISTIQSHKDFKELDDWGKGYLKGLKEAYKKLNNSPSP